MIIVIMCLSDYVTILFSFGTTCFGLLIYYGYSRRNLRRCFFCLAGDYSPVVISAAAMTPSVEVNDELDNHSGSGEDENEDRFQDEDVASPPRELHDSSNNLRLRPMV